MTPTPFAKTKIILLTLGALLIGGLGCSAIEATGIAVETAQHNKAAAAFKLQQEQHFKNLAIAANNGDLAAMTELGIEHLSESPFLASDKQQGKSLVERAASQHFAAAEYYLGIQIARAGTPVDNNIDWLLPAHFSHNLTDMFAPNYAQAIDYLKKSAQHACVVTFTETRKNGFSNTESNAPTTTDSVNIRPALAISQFLKPDAYKDERKKVFTEDENQYELWFARSILHCNFPQTPGIGSFWQSDSSEHDLQLLNMAFFHLTPPEYWNYDYDALAKKMSADDIAIAQKKAQALRLAVKASEKDYPAPAFARAEIDDIITRGKYKLQRAFAAEDYEHSTENGFILTANQLIHFSPYAQEYAVLISQYTNALIVKHIKTENGQTISPEKLEKAKALLDFYMNDAIPTLGTISNDEHLLIAGNGLIVSLATKDTGIADRIFEKILGGKRFNIANTNNYTLVYNIVCYFAIQHRKPELLKAAKKLSENPQKVEHILVDADIADYVNDKDFLKALGRQ